jgi:hypothetical protein
MITLGLTARVNTSKDLTVSRRGAILHALIRERRDLMSQPQQEKRATRRFSLRLPVSIRFTNGGVQEFSAETRDVSARGVFFYIDKRLAEGSAIEFTLTLPPEITLTESIRVRCKGRVIRVEESAEERVGVGAVIDQYDFVAEV